MGQVGTGQGRLAFSFLEPFRAPKGLELSIYFLGGAPRGGELGQVRTGRTGRVSGAAWAAPSRHVLNIIHVP